jgi:hypothetical protein
MNLLSVLLVLLLVSLLTLATRVAWQKYKSSNDIVEGLKQFAIVLGCFTLLCMLWEVGIQLISTTAEIESVSIVNKDHIKSVGYEDLFRAELNRLESRELNNKFLVPNSLDIAQGDITQTSLFEPSKLQFLPTRSGFREINTENISFTAVKVKDVSVGGISIPLESLVAPLARRFSKRQVLSINIDESTHTAVLLETSFTPFGTQEQTFRVSDHAAQCIDALLDFCAALAGKPLLKSAETHATSTQLMRALVAKYSYIKSNKTVGETDWIIASALQEGRSMLLTNSTLDNKKASRAVNHDNATRARHLFEVANMLYNADSFSSATVNDPKQNTNPKSKDDIKDKARVLIALGLLAAKGAEQSAVFAERMDLLRYRQAILDVGADTAAAFERCEILEALFGSGKQDSEVGAALISATTYYTAIHHLATQSLNTSYKETVQFVSYLALSNRADVFQCRDQYGLAIQDNQKALALELFSDSQELASNKSARFAAWIRGAQLERGLEVKLGRTKDTHPSFDQLQKLANVNTTVNDGRTVVSVEDRNRTIALIALATDLTWMTDPDLNPQFKTASRALQLASLLVDPQPDEDTEPLRMLSLAAVNSLYQRYESWLWEKVASMLVKTPTAPKVNLVLIEKAPLFAAIFKNPSPDKDGLNNTDPRALSELENYVGRYACVAQHARKARVLVRNQ